MQPDPLYNVDLLCIKHGPDDYSFRASGFLICKMKLKIHNFYGCSQIDQKNNHVK